MKELFQSVVMRLALCGLAASLVLLLLRSRPVRGTFVRLLSVWRSLTAFGRVAACFFLLVGILIGGDKTNSVPPNVNSPLPQIMQGGIIQGGAASCRAGDLRNDSFIWRGGTLHLLGTLPSSSFAERKAANWNMRGAWKDSFWLPFDDGWVFPLGTNHLSGVEVISYGQVWATPFDTNAVASAGVPLEIVRGLTTFCYEFTPSNSYRFVWTDAAINRDTNNLVTASIELFRNGDYAVEIDGEGAVVTQRVLPFEHDGFGQDAEWVAANFTNATEILAVGYPQWVDSQVGTGLTNGLYRLTVTVPDAPPETTQISVGDLSIAVTNAGEYVFLLEKGPAYDFAVFPPSSNVTISAVDDVPSVRGAPMLRSFGGVDGGQWVPDGGDFWTDYAAGMEYARLWWLPWLCGSPDVTHIGPNDEVTFTAIFVDYFRSGGVAFHWTASDGLSLATPNAQSTAVTVDSMPSWASAFVSVTATFGDQSLTSYLDLSYGTNTTPQVHLSLNLPDTILVYTNVYVAGMIGVLDIVLTSDCETNGTVRLDCIHNAEKVRILDGDSGSPVALPCSWNISGNFSKSLRVEGLVASETCDDIEFLASFSPEDGSAGICARTTSTVADIWHLAVSEEPRTRNRNLLGVGESVIFYYRPFETQLEYSATAGESLPPVDGMLHYSAPHTQAVANVAFNVGKTNWTVPFTVVEPEGIEVGNVENVVYERDGYAGIFEMTFHNRVTPTNVSFYAIETIEIPMVATNATGYYAQPSKADELDHGKRGGGHWGGIGFGNEYVDYAAAGYVSKPWGEGGSFTWPIPVAWRCRGDDGVTNVFCYTDQRFELDANGTVRVIKFGYCGERTTNNVFTLTRISE
jgi:hypothetical protein